jgi:hypothetical protein
MKDWHTRQAGLQKTATLWVAISTDKERLLLRVVE